MGVAARIRGLETIVKGYLVGHALALAALAALGVLGAYSLAPEVAMVPLWAGSAVFGVALLGQLIAIVSGVPPVRAMRWALPLELAAVPLLVWGTDQQGDVAFAVAVAVPMFYVATERERLTWSIGGMYAIAYVMGHAISGMAGAPHAFGDWLGVIFKAAGVVYMAVALAAGVTRQAEREVELREARDRNEALNRQLQRRLTELHAVSEITEIIHSTLDFDTVGPVVIDILQKVIDLPSCSLFVIDKAKAETLFSASKLAPGAQGPRGRGPGYDPARGEAIDSHYSCISVFDHNTMMVVFCAETEAVAAMTPDDRLVLQAVASELVVAVENSQLYKLTRRLAITDELTGLYNYRYLQQRLDEEIERARRYSKHVSLVMFDVDDFKAFNDSHGHIAGDVALADLSSVVRACVREVDVVARYGGEEFSVILPETDATGAYVVAEKIREAVENHAFADATGQCDVHISVSVGVATFPENSYDKETLLRQADDALYRAKGSGKNRVRSPQTKLEPPEPEAAERGVGKP